MGLGVVTSVGFVLLDTKRGSFFVEVFEGLFVVLIRSERTVGATQNFLCWLTDRRGRGEDYGFNIDDFLFDDL